MSRISRVQTYDPRPPPMVAPQMVPQMTPQMAPQMAMQYSQPQAPWVPQMRLFDDMDSHVNTDRLISVILGVIIGVLAMMVYNSAKQSL